VIVVPYDPAWKQDFEKIRLEILDAAADLIERIEHVGSTSVEGLWAKPIIDLDIVIRDRSVFDELTRRLRAIGYEHQGDLGIAGREAFRYDDKPHLRKHHLYAVTENARELRRHTAFRDYLRTHPEAAEEYARIKREGAEKYPENIDAYIAHKGPFIESIYAVCFPDGQI